MKDLPKKTQFDGILALEVILNIAKFMRAEDLTQLAQVSRLTRDLVYTMIVPLPCERNKRTVTGYVHYSETYLKILPTLREKRKDIQHLKDSKKQKENKIKEIEEALETLKLKRWTINASPSCSGTVGGVVASIYTVAKGASISLTASLCLGPTLFGTCISLCLCAGCCNCQQKEKRQTLRESRAGLIQDKDDLGRQIVAQEDDMQNFLYEVIKDTKRL